jgi:uncharacterized protein
MGTTILHSPPRVGESLSAAVPLTLMGSRRLAARLRRLPTATVLGREVRVARGARARLLGLARLDREEVGAGLLLPRCRNVHTFGMRFALDLVFLDRDGGVCSIRRGVPPRRIAFDRRAAAVLEYPALCGHRPPGRGRVFVSMPLEG